MRAPACRAVHLLLRLHSSSPRLKATTRHRAPVARKLLFGMARVTWPEEQTNFFITALVDECRAGNRTSTTLNKTGKDNVEKKIAHVFKRIRLERMEPVNIGPSEDGGHEGGRAGVPTQYVDSDHSGDLEADHDNSCDLEADCDMMHRFSPPPPQPMCTASMTSAARGKRRSSDNVCSSSSMLEGFKNFYKEVSAWKKQKEACSASKKAEEDAEYETLLRELLDGGVDPESEVYYMASAVLENTTRRAAYRPLPNIKAKIAWIKSR
ncbi:hypothetical protein U9M48_034389 [Paspalum notatum var. saurae]|uniref:Uncharacterized protein n=1 Tax=Paspalum notatum var. saurae TaxID=547442 RepID=A0AAQ3U9P1_PASNO